MRNLHEIQSAYLPNVPHLYFYLIKHGYKLRKGKGGKVQWAGYAGIWKNIPLSVVDEYYLQQEYANAGRPPINLSELSWE